MKLKDAKDLCERTMREHGLRVDGKFGSWRFEWLNTKRILGRANSFDRTIKLSTHFVRINDAPAVLEVIRHEVAHGIAGNEAGHGAAWKRKAAELGCSNLSCSQPDDGLVAPPAKWIGKCPICGRRHWRYTRNEKTKTVACTPCCREFNGGKWDANFMLVWSINPEWEKAR